MVGSAAVFLVFEADVFVCQDGCIGVFMGIFVGVWVFRRHYAFYHLNGGIGFEAGNETGPCVIRFCPPVVIATAFVKNIGRTFFRLHEVVSVDVVDGGCGDALGGGAAVGMVHEDMNL